MKLLMVAALVAVATGARLDHLERSYLPPGNGGSQGLASGGSSGFGSNGQSGAFGQGSSGNTFGGATSNQYLPPDQGSSSSNGFGSFSGSPSGFGSNFGSDSGASGSQGSQFNSQSGAGRQYLAPRPSSNSQNTPQQAFDEETGYHY